MLERKRAENSHFSQSFRPDPDYDLLAKATAEISARPGSLSSERLFNFQRWRRHVQSFGDCNRDQERNLTSLPNVHRGVTKYRVACGVVNLLSNGTNILEEQTLLTLIYALHRG